MMTMMTTTRQAWADGTVSGDATVEDHNERAFVRFVSREGPTLVLASVTFTWDGDDDADAPVVFSVVREGRDAAAFLMSGEPDPALNMPGEGSALADRAIEIVDFVLGR